MEHLYKLFIVLTLLLTGCTDSDCLEETPGCILENIRAFSMSIDCEGSSVDEYIFQTRHVYVLNNNCCCDHVSEVFNTDCTVIGLLGGFAGNTVINGVDFSNATFVRTHWEY